MRSARRLVFGFIAWSGIFDASSTRLASRRFRVVEEIYRISPQPHKFPTKKRALELADHNYFVGCTLTVGYCSRLHTLNASSATLFDTTVDRAYAFKDQPSEPGCSSSCRAQSPLRSPRLVRKWLLLRRRAGWTVSDSAP